MREETLTPLPGSYIEIYTSLLGTTIATMKERMTVSPQGCKRILEKRGR